MLLGVSKLSDLLFFNLLFDTYTLYICMQQMPFPPTAQDFFLQALSFGLGLLVILSFLYTAGTITKVIM